jgi:ATP-dependent DNA helicase PIF1
MQHKHAIECVDRSIRELTGNDLPFGGKIVLFAGDFRQTLPIVRRGNLMEQAQATLKASYLWNSMNRFALSVNIRLVGLSVNPNIANINFAKWLLDLGSGRLQDEYAANIELMYCNVSVVHAPATYDPHLLRAEYGAAHQLIRQRNWRDLTTLYSSRCLITPLNKTVNIVNNDIMDSLPGQYHLSSSIDRMDQKYAHPVTADVLNSFNFPGFPSHKLKLKVGSSVMVIRNLNLANGLCNGTRLLITDYEAHALKCTILTGELKGTSINLPKIELRHDGNEDCPIPFTRYQFPVLPAFCMTINKIQGQSLERVTVLLPQPVFSHGQLYVALSRCTTASNVTVCTVSDSQNLTTTNIVYHPVLMN